MQRYRKKPIEVSAVQWEGPEQLFPFVWPETVDGTIRYYVITIHLQKAYLTSGDWIITELDGCHHYPCKLDIFAAMYDLVG